MRDIASEITESFRIAAVVIRAHKMRSILTALGVIIGIIAVTLMGSAIGGIETGFEKSLSVIGDDILYVEKWPWHNVDDWWNYRNRRRMEMSYADSINRQIAETPKSELVVAVPTMNTVRDVKFGDIKVNSVFTQGTSFDYLQTATASFSDGRFFTELEARGGSNVVVLGYDVAETLFPNGSAIDKVVTIGGTPFRVQEGVRDPLGGDEVLVVGRVTHQSPTRAERFAKVAGHGAPDNTGLPVGRPDPVVELRR